VDGKLLVSIANCPGIHAADEPMPFEQADLLFRTSKEYGVPIAAAEFTNEPNMMAMSGLPQGYTAEDHARDHDIFGLWLKENYPELPIVLFGHSMGSFVSRLYATKYPESIDGLVIHGTAGKNPILPFGIFLTKIIKAFRGERHRSAFVRSLADGGYNKKFDKSEGEGAWLTRDGAMVAGRPSDARTNFVFTVSGYADLFEMLSAINTKAWFRDFPKNLPALVISGDCDPVGNFGKGVRYVYDNLKKYGADVDLKLYEGARHELFNETNRDEVFADLIAWIEERALK